MVARRAVATLAVLLAALFSAGCAKTITGHGTIAEDARQPGGGQVTTGTPSASPGQPPSGSPSGSSGSGTNEVCQALDKGSVEKAFGTSVTFKDSQQTGCQITADSGDSMIVAVFDFLTLVDYKRGSFKDLTVSGHAAVRTDANIIYVARSQNPSAEGLLAAYYSGLGNNGEQIATAMLDLLLRKYAR